MRVLHVDSARGWRGGQNQVLLTARGMAARGHDVVLACQAGGALAERARAAGIEVRELGFRGDFSPAAVLPLAAAVRAFAPDTVQLHDPHAVSAASSPAASRSPLRSSPRAAWTSRSAVFSPAGNTRRAIAWSR